LVDRRSGRLHFFTLRPSGNRSIIESRSKAHDADGPPDHDDASTLGDRHSDDFSVAGSTPASADHNRTADGWDGENGQTAVTVCHEHEPERIGSEHSRGRGWGLKECMTFWDRETHMSRGEWRAACQRSQHRLDNLKIDDLTLGIPAKPTTTSPRTQHRSKGRRVS
jgi:hypothetical protein